MKSTYCEYILEKILSTSEVGPILALIAPSPFQSDKYSFFFFTNILCDTNLYAHARNVNSTLYYLIVDIKKI